MLSTLKSLSSRHCVAFIVLTATTALFTACGGGGPNVPATPAALAVTYDVKAFGFTWTASADATSYQLLEDIDGASGPGDFVQVATATTPSIAFAPSGLLHTRLNARYAVQACNSAGCSARSGPAQVDVNKAIGYFKASNTGMFDQFGNAVALSADGNTLVVGAPGEASNATGVNGDSANNVDSLAGAVYVFARAAGAWTQQAYLKASNTGDYDLFGRSLALSADGNTLSVGAPGESSIDGNQGDDSAEDAGAVYIFTRAGSSWAQQAYVKASNIAIGNVFGAAVALSADGNTLAAGAPGESFGEGAAYVFTRTGAAWAQQAILTASQPDPNDHFGVALTLSGDGNTLAVGAPEEDSSATVINGNEGDDLAFGAGAVFVFTHAGATWSQQAYVKASNADAFDSFGVAVSLSGDGNLLVVGAPHESSLATGVNANKTDNNASGAGAVYVFSRTGTTWTEQAYLKASNTAAEARFGMTVALSTDGNTLAVGALGEASSAVGINGNQSPSGFGIAGAAYVFKRTGSAWTQQAYVKASNAQAADSFSVGLALSGDGNTLAVGASDEASKATGIGGDQGDNSLGGAGAVYVY